jgi:hypothetical protein
MYWAYGTCGGEEKSTQDFGMLKESDHLEDLGDQRIM